MNFGFKTRPMVNWAGCCQRRRLAFCLAIALPLLRLTRAAAQEDNELGYRHEFYREDNHRINVDTDSGRFDLKLGSQARVSGEVVFDAISGATPTGAPPQTKWPYATFNDFYASAYQQSYGVQFNHYISENLIYADAGYITFDQLTNYASAFATSTAPPIATNSAAASYHTLTNNPNLHKTTVPLTTMHDFRAAFSLNAPLTFGIHQITPSISYSEESDYVSWGGALNYSAALNDKNTTLNTGWSHNADRVRDEVFVWEDKTSDEMFLGVVQLLDPKSYLTLNCTLGWERGYLADPYRAIMPAANFLQTNPDDPALIFEKRPRHREKQIVYASWNRFFTPLNVATELSYRFYHDSYHIVSHTVELDWHQKIGKHLVISPTFRYYVQSAAYFYYLLVPDYDALPAAYSADYRLSHLQSFAGGVNLTWRIHKHLSLDAAYLRYVMQGLDHVTSQDAYPSANVCNVGLRLWF